MHGEKVNNRENMAVCRPDSLDGAMLSGIISNWLVYFYQPDKTAISQGQTVFIPQGLVVFGIFTIIGGITAFGRIFDAFTDPMIASLSDRCTSKNGRRIPFLKWASLTCWRFLQYWFSGHRLIKTAGSMECFC